MTDSCMVPAFVTVCKVGIQSGQMYVVWPKDLMDQAEEKGMLKGLKKLWNDAQEKKEESKQSQPPNDSQACAKCHNISPSAESRKQCQLAKAIAKSKLGSTEYPDLIPDMLHCEKCDARVHRGCLALNQEAIDLFPGELWACPSCRPPFVRLSQFGYYEVNAAKLFYTDLLLGPPGAQPALPYNSKDMARALGMHEYYLALSEKPPSKPDDNNAFLYTWKANDPKDACFIVDCGFEATGKKIDYEHPTMWYRKRKQPEEQKNGPPAKQPKHL